MQMENNHKILLEKISNLQENNKNSSNMLKDFFEHIERRLERLENK
jgi:hypothetical protein